MRIDFTTPGFDPSTLVLSTWQPRAYWLARWEAEELADAQLAEQQAEDEQARWEQDNDYMDLYGYGDDAVSQGYYDDDPSPYNGDYSEM